MVAALVPAMRDRAAQAADASRDGAGAGRDGALRAPTGQGQVRGDVETGVTAPSYC